LGKKKKKTKNSVVKMAGKARRAKVMVQSDDPIANPRDFVTGKQSPHDVEGKKMVLKIKIDEGVGWSFPQAATTSWWQISTHRDRQ
jgi:hypothetical protein